MAHVSTEFVKRQLRNPYLETYTGEPLIQHLNIPVFSVTAEVTMLS